MLRQLPTIKYKGKKYFRDDRLRQIRNVENPHDFVDFENMETNGVNKNGGRISGKI